MSKLSMSQIVARQVVFSILCGATAYSFGVDWQSASLISVSVYFGIFVYGDILNARV